MFILQRLFSTLLVLLLIAAAALWIMGGKKKENQTSLEFDATPAQIWPYLTEPNGIGQWFSGLVSIDPIIAPPTDPIAAPHPPIRRLVQAADGSRKEFEDQVLRYDPQQIVSLKSCCAGETITWVYKLEPMANNRTNVTLTVVQLSSGLERFLAPLSDNVWLMQVEVDIRKLKEAVEGNGLGGASSNAFGGEALMP